jgi:acyl-CoA synthetase (AMP-forming)/AMP-acid ligase II
MLWEGCVQQFRSAEALLLDGRRVSFEELEHSARVVAEDLRSKPEWRPGFRVGLETSRTDFFFEALGVWIAGGVLVPYCAAHFSGDARLESLIHQLAEGVYGETRWTPGKSFEGERDWHAIYLTSGSTGEPKAVVRGWRQALHEAECYAKTVGVAPGMRCSMLVDPVFGASTKHFWGCLLAGCSQSFGVGALREGHVLYGTPGQIAAFAGAGGSFQWVSMTGEACAPGAWEAAAELTQRKGWILNALGGSEFGVAANQIVRSDETRCPSFCGIPLAGKRLEILDDSGLPQVNHSTGLLQVVSEFLAEGYLTVDSHELCFEPYPRLPDGRTFLTGDVGWLDEAGHFHLLGRAGRMQKRGARWIDTSPLARALESCAGLWEFALEWPAGGFRPVVWCGIEDPTTARLEEITIGLHEAGLDEELMPAELLALPSLPRNRHGKVDLSALKGPAVGEIPELIVHKIPNRVALVAEALARGDAGASIFRGAASLTDLGFDSLALHELSAEISSRLQRRIPVLSLLSGDSLESLIGRLHGRFIEGVPHLQTAEDRPLLVWFGSGVASLAAMKDRSFGLLHLDHDTFSEELPWRQGLVLRDFAVSFPSLKALSSRSDAVFTGGFSFGSLLAHEAGVFLKDRGVRVRGVFLVDPPILDVRSIRSVWRWSRWRPWAWIALLSLPHRCGWRIFRKRLAKEIRMRDRERRRDMMRCYQPSSSTLETILFSSVAHLAASQALFESTTASMQVRRLSAQSHLDVVRQPTAVAEWTAGIFEQIKAECRARV